MGQAFPSVAAVWTCLGPTNSKACWISPRPATFPSSGPVAPVYVTPARPRSLAARFSTIQSLLINPPAAMCLSAARAPQPISNLISNTRSAAEPSSSDGGVATYVGSIPFSGQITRRFIGHFHAVTTVFLGHVKRPIRFFQQKHWIQRSVRRLRGDADTHRKPLI